MKDLIAKLQMDANCALGAIWMHIDAQAARIAELEAQLADWAGLVGDKDGEIYSLRQQLAVASAHQAANTDKLREAISAEQIMRIAGDVRQRNAGAWPGDVAFARAVLASTALQALVREVPGWQSMDSAPKDGQEILLRYPLQGNVKQLASYNTIHNHWESKGGYIWAIESKCEWHPLPDDLPAAPVQEPKP